LYTTDFSTKRLAVVTGYYPTPVLARNFLELARRGRSTAGKFVFIFVYWWKNVPRPAFLNDLETEGVEVKEFTLMGPIRQGLQRGWIRSPWEAIQFNWKAFQEMRAYFSKEKFHLLFFLHTPWYSELMLALAARMAMVPFVMKVFTSTQFPLQPHRWLAHLFIAQLMSRIIVISPEARTLSLLVGYLTPRYTVIRSLGVAGRQFQRSDADPEKIRSEFHLQQGIPILGTVCRIDPIKGQRFFLEVLSLLKKDFPNIKGFIVGGQYDPSETWEKDLKEYAQHLGLSDTVIFTGMREDVENFYALLDVYVHPAIYDLFPFSILEAMAMELPVVASRVGGIPDMVEDGVTGFLVPPRNVHSLYTAIKKLLINPELRMEMGKKGKEKVLQNWTVDRAFSDILAFFKDCLQGVPKKSY